MDMENRIKVFLTSTTREADKISAKRLMDELLP
jgi:hypothetical protein